MEVLAVGSKAYLDSSIGLVPCQVLAITEEQITPASTIITHRVKIQITAKRYGYPKGYTMWIGSNLVVPRRSVYRSRQHCGQYRIRPYEVSLED